MTAESCGREADTGASLLTAVDVSGEVGQQPQVTLPTPFVAHEAGHLDIVSGDGDVVESMGQPAAIELTLVDGASGTPIPMTAYSGDDSQVLSLEAITQQLPGLESALTCAAEGTRTVVAFGDDGVTEQFAAQLAQVGLMAQSSTLFAVVDVLKVLPGQATGSAVYNDGHGLPTVVRAPDGTPGIVIPAGAAPEERVVQTLIRGEGEEIAAGDVVTVKFTSVDWATRSVGDSTWAAGQAQSGALSDIPGGEALEGQTVGSQVLVVEPDDEGGATATVIDVLEAVPAA